MNTKKYKNFYNTMNIQKILPVTLFLLLLNCNAKFNNPTDGAGGLLANYMVGLVSNLATSAKPSITVKVGDTEYKNGDTITFTATKSRTDFSQKFQIYNNTTVNLNLTGAVKVAISGTGSANFTVIQPTVTTLIPNSSSEFTINFKTEYTPDKSATAVIANDDLTASNFSINLIGKYAGSGDFVYTGSLGTVRLGHEATLLSNGKVLISGGSIGSSPLSTAELYDPSTELFTATGSMGTARNSHSATFLLDGKVLVCGGLNGSYLSSAELYDPTSGLFTVTGTMGTARNSHSATRLQDGRVLIAGGRSPSIASAELYDSSTGLFTATGSMGTPRSGHGATLLPNGKVLIAGGGSITSAELYDPSTGLFTPTGSMGTAHSKHLALLLNGKVLIASGGVISSAELYDPSTGLFTSTGSMGTPHTTYHTLLSNGRVLIAGGTSTSTPFAELYFP